MVNNNNEISKETREQLEIARSKVRTRLSYVAGGLFAFLAIWGSVWMADRSIMVLGLNTCVAIIFFWFGQRSAKPPEFK